MNSSNSTRFGTVSEGPYHRWLRSECSRRAAPRGWNFAVSGSSQDGFGHPMDEVRTDSFRKAVDGCLKRRRHRFNHFR